MEQLKFKDLAKLFNELEKTYSVEEILEMPVYISDDDEVNGIHCAWYCEQVSKDDEDVAEMINDRAGNYQLQDKAILIS